MGIFTEITVLPLALVVACFPVGDPLGAADFPFLVLDLLVLGLPLQGGVADLLVLAGALQAGGL